MATSRHSFRFGGCLCCGPNSGTLSLGRRAVLTGAATALATPSILRAQGAAPTIPAVAHKQVIDVHHHFVPPGYLAGASDVLAKSGVNEYPPYMQWTPARTLEEMDRNNVGLAILSISTPGVWFGDNTQGQRLARLCNDYAAQMRRDHPGRFGLFAAIALPDTESALAETAYAMDTLKADGIGLMTSYADRYLGDQSFWPVYEEFNRRRATVFVHPQSPMCCAAMKDFINPSFVEFPTDSTRTILSLLYNGAFAKFPDINWIFCHNGGTLPMLVGRVMQLGHAPADAKRVPPDSIPQTIKRLYFEVANSANKASISAAMAVADPSHMLFGSDYPYVPVGATEGGLMKVGLSPQEIQAILRDNALRLMPSLKSA